MKTVLIIITLVLYPVAHHALLKWLPYRWLVNSLAFPFHWNKLRLVVRIADHSQLVDLWFKLDNNWSSKYWFGSTLINMVANKLIYIDSKQNVQYIAEVK